MTTSSGRTQASRVGKAVPKTACTRSGGTAGSTLTLMGPSRCWRGRASGTGTGTRRAAARLTEVGWEAHPTTTLRNTRQPVTRDRIARTPSCLTVVAPTVWSCATLYASLCLVAQGRVHRMRRGWHLPAGKEPEPALPGLPRSDCVHAVHPCPQDVARDKATSCPSQGRPIGVAACEQERVGLQTRACVG